MHLPHHGRPRHSGWHCSTEHLLSWSRESSAAHCALHGDASSLLRRRPDSAADATARRQLNSKARTAASIPPCAIRYPQHYRFARGLRGIDSDVWEHRASGARASNTTGWLTNPSTDLASRGVFGCSTDLSPRRANRPIGHVARYLDQYLTRYQPLGGTHHHIAYLSYRPPESGRTQMANHTGHRSAVHPAIWQQTTSAHTCRYAAGAIWAAGASRIYFAIGVSPPCTTPRRACWGTATPTLSRIETGPCTTTGATAPDVARAGGCRPIAAHPVPSAVWTIEHPAWPPIYGSTACCVVSPGGVRARIAGRSTMCLCAGTPHAVTISSHVVVHACGQASQ